MKKSEPAMDWLQIQRQMESWVKNIYLRDMIQNYIGNTLKLDEVELTGRQIQELRNYFRGQLKYACKEAMQGLMEKRALEIAQEVVNNMMEEATDEG